MPKDFNLGLVFLSYLVAVTASHVTLILATRVRDPHSTSWKLWTLSGGFAMGIGIWSMHFVATAALWIAFHLSGQRAVFTSFGAALVMGAAVVGMHFTAVAAAKFDINSVCLAAGPILDEEWMAY